MPQFVLDKRENKPDGDDKPQFELIPANTVLMAEVVSVEVREAPWLIDDNNPALGKRQEVNFRFKIIDEYFNGRTVFGKTPTTFSDHPDCKLRQWVEELFSVDSLPEGFGFDPADLVGIQTDVIIGNRKKKDNSLTEFVDSVKRIRNDSTPVF